MRHVSPTDLCKECLRTIVDKAWTKCMIINSPGEYS